MNQKLLGTITIVIIVILGFLFFNQGKQKQPTSSQTPPTTTSGQTVEQKDIEVIAQDLKIPWEVAFLPDNEILVTERPGNLLKIGKDRKVIKIEGVQHKGEGGLLGLALHPKFQDNQLFYLYLTTKEGAGTINRVERYKLDNDKLVDKKVIIDKIPGAAIHDGGRIKFGPDGKLYVTTGDANNQDNGQNKDTLAAKILRVNDDGQIPQDNPFGSAVWSLGHRNPQGLAWDDKGRMWSSEHGSSACDELNLIEKGKNYGWPVARCEQSKQGMVSPVIQSGTDETWAPSGAAFHNGKIYFAGLRGETLYAFDISTSRLNKHLISQFGRLRAVVVGPDNLLYITTSNTDGRGTPKENDDKLIRINPATLK